MDKKKLYESIMKNVAKEVKKAINENLLVGNNKFTSNDIAIAIEYLDDYYRYFPEEKGQYPNWGELDSYNERYPDLFEALMDGEDNSVLRIIDKIWEVCYKK